MSATAVRENSAEQWDRLRFREAMPEPAPLYQHRIGTILTILSFALRQAPGPAAVLDLGAGNGAVGRYARLSHEQGTFPAFVYHATEQSEAMREVIKLSVPDASVAVWSYGDTPLTQSLETADDAFSRQYPVVLLSHVLEHVPDYYGLLDEAWSCVKPGGFLVVCVPRNDEHRSHFTTWDWNRLLAALRQYAGPGVPIGCWECGAFADLFAAVPKPGASGASGEVSQNGQQRGPVQVKVHADERVQGSFPTALDTEAQTRVNGKAVR